MLQSAVLRYRELYSAKERCTALQSAVLRYTALYCATERRAPEQPLGRVCKSPLAIRLWGGRGRRAKQVLARLAPVTTISLMLLHTAGRGAQATNSQHPQLAREQLAS